MRISDGVQTCALPIYILEHAALNLAGECTELLLLAEGLPTELHAAAAQRCGDRLDVDRRRTHDDVNARKALRFESNVMHQRCVRITRPVHLPVEIGRASCRERVCQYV